MLKTAKALLKSLKMPLTSRTHNNRNIPNTRQPDKTGILYVVATPIGNPDDITIRAVNVLGKADYIAAEDTRKTGQLLSYHNIKGKLVSCHEHNEAYRALNLVEKLKKGASVALVSDAGTPSVSDPGYRLVQEVIKNNIRLVPVPGVSAAITALSVSGLPTDEFMFTGFLPKKKSKRIEKLQNLSKETSTLLFYESPKRVLRLIDDIMYIMGDRFGVLSREMTKPYEEFIRGRMSEIKTIISNRDSLKGECTLLVSGINQADMMSVEDLRNDIKALLKENGASPSSLAKEMAGKTGFSRKKVYDEILRMQNKNE
jgi:16S rRNA (cytidine1402-2'-O)-methyltransferase